MKFKVVLFLLISTIGFSQKKKINEEYDYIKNYYQFVYEAQYEYYKDNYQKAYDLLKKAESNCPLLNQPEIKEIGLLAECAARLNKPEEAVYYLEILAKDYGYKVEGLKNDSIYSNLKSFRKWEKLLKKAPKYYKNYLANVDLDLRKEIFKMIEEDQSVRINRDYEGLKRVDSINDLKLRKIVADCDCFPDEMFPQFGNFSIDDENLNVTFFAFHVNRERAEYWKPIYLDLIKRGRAPAEMYGSLIDSNLRSTGLYDYGIYNNVKPEQINDFENLDKRRISVGLAPWQLKKDVFELITKKYNIKWE